jgi:hypothetical protein
MLLLTEKIYTHFNRGYLQTFSVCMRSGLPISYLSSYFVCLSVLYILIEVIFRHFQS